MSFTDYIIIVAFLFFGYRGAKKGLFKSLLGPISLVIATAASYIYYRQTHNILMSLAIATFGPFALNIGLTILLGIIQKITKKENKLSGFSQLLGALLNILWSGTILILSIFLITLLPINFSMIKNAKADIASSRIFAFIDQFLGNRMSRTNIAVKNLSDALEDPKKLKEIRASKEYKRLRNNETFQDLLNDDELLQQVKDKNYASLAKNPKVIKLLEDEEFVAELLKLNQKLLRQGY